MNKNPLIALYQATMEDDCLGLSAEMAYYLTLSLVPALISLVSLFGLIGQASHFKNEFLAFIQPITPYDIYLLASRIFDNVISSSSEGIAIVNILVAVWAGSNGASVILKGLSRAYSFSDKRLQFLRNRFMGILLITGLGVFLLLSAELLIVMAGVKGLINQFVALEGGWKTLVPILQWVIPLVQLVFVSVTLYWLLPKLYGKPPAQIKVLPGALVFISIWFVSSKAFELYVVNFGQYDQIYGALGTVIILMIWLYILAFALLLGGEVNALVSDFSENKNPDQQK